jgi:hypothetical protein
LDRWECEGPAGRTAYVAYLRATGAARTGYGFRPVGEDGGAGFGFGGGFGGAGCPGAGGWVEDPVYFVVLSRLSARPKVGKGEREGGEERESYESSGSPGESEREPDICRGREVGGFPTITHVPISLFFISFETELNGNWGIHWTLEEIGSPKDH